MNGETLLAEERIFLDDAAAFIDKNIHELGRELCKIGYFGEHHRKDCEPPIVDRSYFANLTELEKSLDGDNRAIKSLSKRCKEDIRIGYYQSNIDYLRPRIDALKKKKAEFISGFLDQNNVGSSEPKPEFTKEECENELLSYLGKGRQEMIEKRTNNEYWLAERTTASKLVDAIVHHVSEKKLVYPIGEKQIREFTGRMRDSDGTNTIAKMMGTYYSRLKKQSK
ncbi:hypothetical protein FACS189493_5060 [Spirochaetia bacterium]|nr:hypothetical protein FACS189493_5060 [Spirochaetia bacterium]